MMAFMRTTDSLNLIIRTVPVWRQIPTIPLLHVGNIIRTLPWVSPPLDKSSFNALRCPTYLLSSHLNRPVARRGVRLYPRTKVEPILYFLHYKVHVLQFLVHLSPLNR